MGTRSIISFTPSKDMNVTFDPFKLPEGNPFAPFYDDEDLKKALRNVKKNTEEVRFKGRFLSQYFVRISKNSTMLLARDMGRRVLVLLTMLRCTKARKTGRSCILCLKVYIGL